MRPHSLSLTRLPRQPACATHRERWPPDSRRGGWTPSPPRDVTPPAAGRWVWPTATRVRPRAVAAAARAPAHRAQTVCEGAVLSARRLHRSPPRVRPPPKTEFGEGVTPPRRKGGWVWSTATRVTVKGVPQPARTPVAALSPAGRPFHTVQKPRREVLRLAQAPTPPRGAPHDPLPLSRACQTGAPRTTT